MFAAILVSLLLTSLALMLAFPLTPTGKAIRRVLVEAPARFLADLTWAKAGQTLLVGGALLLFAVAAPETALILASMGTDAAMLEVMLIVWLASVSGSVRSAWRSVQRIVETAGRSARRIIGKRNRSRSPRRAKSQSCNREDDQSEPNWAFA